MFHVKHSNKIADLTGISGRMEKIMNELMTLTPQNSVMKNDGIGDSYALEEVEKLWSKDI